MVDINTGNVLIKDNIGDDLKVVNNTLGSTVNFDTRGLPSSTGSFDFETSNGESYRTIELYLTGIAKIR